MDEHWSGLTPPDAATCAWGARAIYQGRGAPLLDFLPDHQSYRGAKITKKVFKALVSELRRAVALAHPDPTADHTYEVEHPKHPGWRIRFNPRASHGYMYCLIWRI